MTKKESKKIGSKQGIICVAVGILIAQIIMTYMTFRFSPDIGFIKSFFWFSEIDYKFNILIGAIIMLLCGYFYGQIAGSQILIKKRSFIIVGFLCGIAVLLTTGFLCGWTGFFQEGIDNIGTNDNPFEDYIFKPLYWIAIYGIVPASIVGLWFGWQIKRQSRKT